AFAAWCVGATVVTTGSPCDIAISTTGADGAEQQIIVTLAALARVTTVDLPAGGVDEARELATYGDAFAPYLVPASTDAALDEVSYADLVETGRGALHRRVRVEGDLQAALREALAVWADDGSVLLLRNVQEADVEHRLATEGATS
ncbi:MAG: TIGR03089 family protein, partial [Allobranchiibius sp.]